MPLIFDEDLETAACCLCRLRNAYHVARCVFLTRDSISSWMLGEDEDLEGIVEGLKHNTTLTTLMWES